MKTTMREPDDDLKPAHELAAESRQALATLWVKAQPIVAAFIASAIRDSHRTDDLLQEVARIAAVKFDEFDRSRSFNKWALGIARFEIMRFRRSQVRNRILYSDSMLEQLADVFEIESEYGDARKRALRQCLDGITGRRRLVLEMRYQRDLRPQSIATRLGISANAVLLLLHRARRSLADCVSKRLLQEGH